jgi:hypothetical protein
MTISRFLHRSCCRQVLDCASALALLQPIWRMVTLERSGEPTPRSNTLTRFSRRLVNHRNAPFHHELHHRDS